MNEISPGVLIVGGGVTGLAAAQVLSAHDLPVHIVEKQSALGGHATMWPCMATESCMNCGACLSLEMAAQVKDNPEITLHTNTSVAKTSNSKNGFAVELNNGQELSVQKIICATGFSLFPAQNLRSYHVHSHANLLTAAELNSYLKEQKIDERLQGKSAPQVAFIQCAGSRNRSIGRDFCSQVCCKVSLRQANKLQYLYPEAQISIFHMDLQVLGKEARSLYSGLASKAELIQGLPAEILENKESGMLRVITEDRENMSRTAREFDMIVLAVGMDAAQNMSETAFALGLTQNPWGFFNTQDARLAENIQVAGCARSPGDIMTCIQEGRIAADRVLQELNLNVCGEFGPADQKPEQPRVAVLGTGAQAVAVAEQIAGQGWPTYLIGSQSEQKAQKNLNCFQEAELQSVSGTVGNFKVEFQEQEGRKHFFCNAVIAAWEPQWAQVMPELGTENALSSEEFSELVAARPEDCPEDIIILLDYSGPEQKIWVRRALEDALKARAAGKNVCIVAQKMLVHKAEGQRLYDTARKEGVTFLRYESQDDVSLEKTSDGFLLTLAESTLPASTSVSMVSSCLVLPPKTLPSGDFAEKSTLLGQKLDAEGFLQEANVRFRLTGSPRQGIFFAGAGHDEVDAQDLQAEIEEIIACVRQQFFAESRGESEVAINEGLCAKCLTCYRICPHSAIVLTEKRKPRIMSEACFSCQLCVTSCPAQAIGAESYSSSDMLQGLKQGQIAVFACERSAYLAANDYLETAGQRLSESVQLIKIPCASRISLPIILQPFLQGASKVMIAGCHQGNCRSGSGPHEALAAIKQARDIPGTDSAEIEYKPVAANEADKIKDVWAKNK